MSDADGSKDGLLTEIERIRDSVPDEAWYAFYRRNAELARDDLIKALCEMSGIPGAHDIRSEILESVGEQFCLTCGRHVDDGECPCDLGHEE